MNKNKIYIGYDESQDVAYNVCNFSIKKHITIDVEIKKINNKTVDGYNRDHDPLASTPFTYARFYIPFINNYKGVSIFCDGDFLFLDDIKKLIDYNNEPIQKALDNNDIIDIACLQIRENFFTTKSLDEYLKDNTCTTKKYIQCCKYKILLFQIIHTLATLQDNFPGFKHNNLVLKNILLRF